MSRFRRYAAFLLVFGSVACGGGGGAEDVLPDQEQSLPPGVVPPEAVLEAASDTSGAIVVGDTRVAYRIVGDGPPIIVVHGGPGLDQQYLRPGLDRIGEFAQAIYMDQRGTGASTGPLDESTIRIEALVADIDAARRLLGHERVYLLGHSWGGILAMAYALEHPREVEGLILMNSAEPGSRFAAQMAANQRDSRSPADRAQIQELATSEAFAAGDPTTVGQLYRAAFRGTLADPSDLDLIDLEISERTAANGNRVTQLLGATMEAPDWWEELGGLPVPALVIHGRHDPLPVEMAQALADTIPRGEIVLLPNSGHFPYVEEPEATIAAIRGFVTR